MTRPQIHLEFMKAAMAMLIEKPWPTKLAPHPSDPARTIDVPASFDEAIAAKVTPLADAALAAYERRWPDLKFED